MGIYRSYCALLARQQDWAQWTCPLTATLPRLEQQVEVPALWSIQRGADRSPPSLPPEPQVSFTGDDQG